MEHARERCGFGMVYDVCHNIAKYEEHKVDGRKQAFACIARARRAAFPAGHPLVPDAYRTWASRC